MKILVIGAGGVLGRTIVSWLSRRHDVVPAMSASLDVRDAAAVRARVAAERPDAVVNCAAYTGVDAAEDAAVEALEVNAFAVRTLAAAASASNAAFVHYSTDFVFDGHTTIPYVETDVPNPRGIYACSKLIGEWFAAEAPRYYVLRVETLFGSPVDGIRTRRTSVDRIVDALLAGETARVFTDRVVTPSFTEDVAAATEMLLEDEAASGLYHCVNSGACTMEELAREAAAQLQVAPRLELARMAEAGLRAERPSYCALNNDKLRAAGFAMPSWQDALRRYLQAPHPARRAPGATR